MKKNMILVGMLFCVSLSYSQENETEKDQTKELEEVTVQAVGSRNSKRTVINTAVPIDIINVKEVTTQSGKIEINELLQYVAPSEPDCLFALNDGATY